MVDCTSSVGVLFLVTGPAEEAQFIKDLIAKLSSFVANVPCLSIEGEASIDYDRFASALATGSNIIVCAKPEQICEIETEFFDYPVKVLYVQGKSAGAMLDSTIAATNNIFTIVGKSIDSAMASGLGILASKGRVPLYHRDLAQKYEDELAAAKVVEEELEEDQEEEGLDLDDEDDEDLELELAPIVDRSPAMEAAFEGEDFVMEAAEGGDQFMAVKPWIGAICEPAEYKAGPGADNAPDATLELEWVHGYRAQDTRGNLHYSVTGDIVYTTAAVGVVYNKTAHTQTHHIEHTDDIVCCVVSPDGTKVATGQMGKKGTVMIWDAATCATLATLKGFHRRGVCNVAWSSDGTKIASVGEDNDHSIAVYDWESGKKVSSAKGGTYRVLDIKFAADGSLVTCGKKHVRFWTSNGPSLKSRKGIFGRKAKIQSVLCIGFVGDDTITGTASGDIYKWKARKCVKIVDAHKRCLNSLSVNEHGVCTGGRDGLVKLWDSNLKPLATFDIASLGSFLPAVRSVEWNNVTGTVLVGTRGSEVYELPVDMKQLEFEESKEGEGAALVQGHCADELWGVAAHPSEAKYVTVGDDKSIRVWDIASCKQVQMAKLKYFARAVAYSPDGTLIAVGTGGRVGTGNKAMGGGVLVLDAADLSVKFEVEKSETSAKEWISEIKFSPDGSVLAVGSHDNNIYLYDIVKESEPEPEAAADDEESKAAEPTPFMVNLKSTLAAHKSYVTHFDFSDDGENLQSNCGAYELLFWDANKGEHIASAARLANTDWQSWTCTLGWPVQGIWPQFADGTDVNAVCRSGGGTMLASADDFGKIKLFKYPCITPGAEAHEYRGHSSHVTNVRFADGDNYVISTGGNDRSVFQWKVDNDTQEEEAEEEDIEDEDVEAEIEPVTRSDAEEAAFEGVDFTLDMEAGGDQFMAVKPWQGALVCPDEDKTFVPTKGMGDVPDCNLELDWVHGYCAQGVRNNLHYTAAGDIVYTAAGVGVVYNKKAHSQNHHIEHTDDVICCAVSPDGTKVATGQVGKRPTILIWDANTCETLASLKGFHKRGVCQVAWSEDGMQIASVGQDDRHSIAIWDWKSGKKIVSAKGDTSKVLDIKFAPGPAPGTQNLVTCGKKHVKFWTMKGRNLRCKKGIFGKLGKIQTVLSIGFAGGKTVTGTASGHLYVWEGRTIVQAIDAHSGSVNALSSCPSGIASGGKDGEVKLWNKDLSQARSFKNVRMDNFESYDSKVRSVCWNDKLGKVLVGTQGSEIYELMAIDGTCPAKAPLIQGHCKHELWGLAAHPIENKYATVGDDKTLRVWDIGARKQVAMSVLPQMARAVAYSPNGKYLVVGLGGDVGGRGDDTKDSGAFIVFDGNKLESIKKIKEASEWISDIKFSPDGSTLAVGSHDNNIYLYDTSNEEFKNKGQCDGHKSYITHFDFSANGENLQSNCGAYELLFWDATSGDQVTSATSLRNQDWSTWTCTLGWSVQGIWPKFADGTDVNSVSRSASGTMIATADDFGKVKLFKYPCLGVGYDEATGKSEGGALASEYRGHSSHVTNVRFTLEDDFVISVGGNDRSVFQWKVDLDEDEEEAVEEDFEDEDVDAEIPVVERPAPKEVPADASGDAPPVAWKVAVESMMEKRKEDMEAADPEGGEFKAPEYSADAPEEGLELQWVHGYRAHDARNNLHYTGTGDIVYTAAGVGIVYNKNAHSQNHHIEHTDDIICCAVSPDGTKVATGQVGNTASVIVWDAGSCGTLAVLKGFHKRGVCQVAWSEDGTKIASVGQDDNHSIAVYDWEQERKIGSCKGGSNKVLDIKFAPGPAPGTQNLVTCGEKHVKFWTMKGRNLKSKKGIFGKLGKIQTVLSIGFAGGKTVTGTASGHLYVWEGRSVVQAIDAHTGSVNALSSCSGGIASGGKDGKIKLWTSDMRPKCSFEVGVSRNPSVRSICWNPAVGKVLVGTRASEIYEYNDSDGVCQRGAPLAQAHYSGQLWGLATKPYDGTRFVTCADDNTLRLWDTDKYTMLQAVDLGASARAIAYSPDGTTIAAGLETGGLAVYESNTMSEVTTKSVSKEGVTDLKFSPDGETIAVASKDNRIYLYDVSSSYRRYAICKGHTAGITHVDFSADGQFLQSTSPEGELFFWRVEDGKQVKSVGQFWNTEWASFTGTLGWQVQGIWPTVADGTEPSAVCRSNSSKLLGYADGFGKVKVYKYPCVGRTDAEKQAPSDAKSYDGHSSNVTNARFSHNDRHLMTIGGNDKSIFQWQLKK